MIKVVNRMKDAQPGKAVKPSASPLVAAAERRIESRMKESPVAKFVESEQFSKLEGSVCMSNCSAGFQLDESRFDLWVIDAVSIEAYRVESGLSSVETKQLASQYRKQGQKVIEWPCGMMSPPRFFGWVIAKMEVIAEI